MAEKKSEHVDLIQRGEYGFDAAGAATFAGLRGLDPFLQNWIILNKPLERFFPSLKADKFADYVKAHPSHPNPRHDIGGTTLTTPNGTAFFTFPNLATTFTYDNLTAPNTILTAMPIISAVKQIYTMLFVSNEAMAPGACAIVSAFNTVNNSLNSLLFTIRFSNPTYSDPSSLYIGTLLFVIGMVVEPLSELQRKSFKQHQAKIKTRSSVANVGPKSRIYTGGLFGLARNINYGGYTLWRTGYSLAAGGWIWGGLCAAFFVHSFASRSIPIMEDYLRGRYGEEEWKRATEEVPYRLFPYIY